VKREDRGKEGLILTKQAIEIKKQKEHDKKKEEINKKVTHSVNIWEKTILPQWNKK
jgi:hypothetical protein